MNYSTLPTKLKPLCSISFTIANIMLQQHLGVFRTCTNIYDSPYLIWLLVVNSRVPLTEPSTAIFEFQTGFQVNILNHDSQTFNKRYAH